ncbi:Transcription initiation factor TFIID subunit 6 [Castilleja foliolosa]|uniref:Transcription initiation factor TFIID subunit 6 n=1 Tax=Castilleja foliolosa TaxID=1961234 RepID=A0ABD3CSP7_9LAMI
MSIVPKDTIEVIAQSVGITNLSSDVLPALAADVEYRVREIMQEAIKCMRHSRRTTLTTKDVDSALGLRNIEPIYGFASGDPKKFRRAAGHKDLFYIEEKDVEFKEVIEAPLPRAPLDTAMVAHWLAIEGVQPAIPENPPPEALQMLSLPADNRNTEAKEDRLPIDLKLPIKHVLSRELQLYFEKITELTLSKSESPLFKAALVSLATDSGIHPLVPYFTFFVADEVARNLNNFPLLFALMRLVRSLLRNTHIHIEPYLHQLMPSVLTCLVAKRLGHKLSDNHWDLRNFTANMIASICKRFGLVYHNLQSRVTNTLSQAFLDPLRALPQHYGAIQGLAALGPNVIRYYLLPNIGLYLRLLEPEMQLEKQKNEMKRHEAWLVYGTLLSGLSVYDRSKMLPSLTSPPLRTVWKTNSKVITTVSNKRKTSMDNMMHQPPQKKLMTDNFRPGNSLPTDMAGRADPNLEPSSSSRPSMNNNNNNNNNVTAAAGKELNGGGKGVKKKKADAWMELYEEFGESMLCFVPSAEASLFI